MSQILDNETGERLSTDAETGEPEMEETVKRKRFRVPGNLLLQQPQDFRGRRVKYRKKMHQCYFKHQRIKTNIVKEMIKCTRKNVGPIVFMIPTFLICPGWASLLCLLGEACMHIWSHKRFPLWCI